MKHNISSKIRYIALLLAVLVLLCSSCGKKDKPKDKTPLKDTTAQSENMDTEDIPSESEDENTDDKSLQFDDEMSEDDVFTPVIDLDKIDWGGLSGDNSSEETTLEETQIVFNPQDMFDKNELTYWSPYTEEKTQLEFSLPSKISFNAIDFVEQRSYITDFTVEIKEKGKYKQICKIDEMGTRTCILDDTFTAKDFRFSITMSDYRGGVAEIGFTNKIGFKNGKNFRNVGYFPCQGIKILREEKFARLADKISGYTDFIFFDFGSWDKNGTFLWESMHKGLNEQEFATILGEFKALKGAENLNIWFCLQNYNRPSTTTTDELFVTQEARDKLIEFSVYMCETYDLCGIDIDYEYPTTKLSWKNYDVFLEQLADALHAKGYKLSSAMAPFDITLSDSTISKIDYINIMSYDLFDKVGRHASYAYSRQHFIYFTDLGFKPEQLVMGLPFYTRTMDSKHEYGKSYNGLAERWRGGIKPWVNVVTDKKWVFYFNGANMIRDKVYYSMNEGMSGVFNWTVNGDLVIDNKFGVASLGDTIIKTIERFSK